MASPAPRQHQPARPQGRLTKGSAARPPREGYGLDTVLPWRQALLPPADQPPEQVAPPIVPVAWLGRTSTEDSQDPTISLPRQLRNSRDALPDGFIIVSHFYDVESGRKNLDDRGSSRAHEQFDIPVPRDGGIQDLLTEAARPDRRFVAVIAESIERVARRTYFGTKIEHQLEQSGVALLAADEPVAPGAASPRGGWSRKRATPVLTRRVKQAIAEWYVLQMLELSWDGFCAHTEQGWNIGKPCYGYAADKKPHPVPARRAEGKTKTRLIPDPARSPVVTTIFQWRALEQLGYDAIADRLNTDLTAHPPPQPVDPRRAVGRWTGSAVREILANPKYTGYMVWNRRASKKGGQHNPAADWVWSPQPRHEPLITRDLFEAASPVGRRRQGSRTRAGANSHPQTSRSYPLRSYVFCDLYDRRMFGKTRRQHAYYACQPDPHHHDGRAGWYPAHPASLWVREDTLLDLVHAFFAERILGPSRHDLLRTQLAVRAVRPDDHARTARQGRLHTLISDIERRQKNLITRLEQQDDTGNPETDQEYRQGIQRRFAELAAEHRARTEELAQLKAATPGHIPNDPDLLTGVPQLPLALGVLPEALQRSLYDAFQLQVRYHRPRHEVTIRVTIRADALPSLTQLVKEAAGQPCIPAGNGEPDDVRSHVLSAPGRIRTCAPASGGRCSIP